ncbi:MAG: hypothetical protein RMM08_01315 [Armatimonadota bacterium]|nr:IPT/TIG domain-containing protein [bacterium]MDW8319975.1 hypothetical protein [Armatimonadota bacterium]
MSRRIVLLLLCTLSSGFLPAHAQFFEYLRPPIAARLNSLSGNGNAIAAVMVTSQANEPAVWSIMDGWMRLFPGAWGSANGVSLDGSVVVGFVNDSAFLWRTGQTPRLFASPSKAWALDDAATRFILWRDYAALRDLATDRDIKAWPSSGLGYLYTIMPQRVSRNGSTLIGEVTGTGRTEIGFVERVGGAYIPLPRYATPQAVSADGSLVAGASWDSVTSRWEAFLWSESSGMVILPRLPVQAQGRTMPLIGGVWLGADGRPRVVGSWRVPFDDPEAGWYASEGEPYAAVIWHDVSLPPQYLRHYLQSLAPAGDPILPLGRVQDVSADGNVMAGDSVPGGVWRATLVTTPASTPAPELTNLSPSTVPAGSGSFTLVVEGRGFRPNAIVQWDGSALPTTYISPTSVQADVPDWAVASPGTAQVVVLNPYVPPPGGKYSNSLTVIIGTTQSPVISRMSPSGVRAGSTGVNLRVQGSHFTSASQIEFDGALLTTTFVSPGELRADLPDEAIGTPGAYAVRVYEPSLNDYSNSLQFVVTVAIPAITRLTPNSILQNPSSNFTVQITGSGFENGVQAYFSGNPLPTVRLSSTELRASVSRSLAANAGTYYVNVYNPGSGQWSNVIGFRVIARRITPPPPPPGTGPGGSPSLRMTDAYIAPNVVSQVFVTVKNEGGGEMTGGRLTSATLNGLPAVLLSDPGLSQLAAGESAQLIFQFITPNLRSGQSLVIRVTGTSDQGAWSVSRVVTVP